MLLVIEPNPLMLSGYEMKGRDMEHNPLLSCEDGLEITYSDLKSTEDGRTYVTLYFEKPNGKSSAFDSAQYDYPGSQFTNVRGFSDSDLCVLKEHVRKSGALAYQFSKEDS